MARPKKGAAKKEVVAAPKPKTYTLNEEQFKMLQSASELISEARRELHSFEPENLAAAGFTAGQAYVSINKAEDIVDDLVNFFNEDDWSWDDDDDDN